jgi:hypothetical protein
VGADFGPSESDVEEDDSRGTLQEYIGDEHRLLKKQEKKDAKRAKKQKKDRRNRFDNRGDSNLITPLTQQQLDRADDDKGWDDLRNFTSPKPPRKVKDLSKAKPRS